MNLLRIFVGCFLIMMGGGCAKWSQLTDSAKKPEAGLPTPQMSPDAVAVDTVFVRLNEQQSEALPNAWASVNEQAIDIQVRRMLDRNGIRAGVIMGELPHVVQSWVSDSDKRIRTELQEQASIAADVSSHVQRLVCKAGRRKELVVRGAKEGQIVIIHNDGVIKGKTYDQPALLFDLRMFPNRDGTANIRLSPEIQFGPLKSTFVSQEGAWRRESRRSADTWAEATVESKLSPGQLLMVTGTEEPKGIGESFFWTETADQKKERIVLLIRLSRTQLNDLFDSEGIAASQRAMETK